MIFPPDLLFYSKLHDSGDHLNSERHILVGTTYRSTGSKLKEKPSPLTRELACNWPRFSACHAVDFKAAGGVAIQLLIVAKKDDLAGPVAADDMAVRLGAQHAGIGQQQHRVGRRLRAMPAEEIQAGREAQGMRAAHLQLHARADLDTAAIG